MSARRTARHRTRRIAVLVAVLVSLLAAPGANAAFPGDNGLIAYTAVGGDTFPVLAWPSGRTLISVGFAAGPAAWSADGRRLVTVHQLENRGPVDLSVADDPGPDGRLRTLVPEGITLVRPAFSPDGTSIAYMPSAGDFPPIRVIRSDGTGDHIVTDEAGYSAVSWSPDGEWIAFARNNRITLIRPDGRDARPITPADGGAGYPDFSPDGRLIAYARAIRPRGIYIVDADGGPPQQLTDGTHDHPVWSPDGKRLAYVDRDESGPVIVVIAADGTSPQQVARGAAPSWQPIDSVEPRVAIAAPADGASFVQGARVSSAYSCTDPQPGSGVVACDGPAPSGAPIDTSAPGNHRFAVTAVDRMGNRAQLVHGYVVEADRDGDAVPDARDNCADAPNADQADADSDGVGDACEPPPADQDLDGIPDSGDNCRATPNPSQADADRDGVGDACESAPGGPARDDDGDSIADDRDNCPAVANRDQADEDGDGLGDVCDIAPSRDEDRDTVADERDNCPQRWNPDQADGDRDGVGDVCDVPSDRDADRDGVPDARDNCPDAGNSDQQDGDEDAIGDACEVLPPGDAPAVAGVRAVVQAVSGEVFVRLPRARRLSQSPPPGFVPLKGIASVPVGSTVDVRKGRIALTSAANNRAAADSRRRIQSGTFSAAIFAIKQRRARRRAERARAARTDLVLRTPPGLARACARPRRVPLKGIIRAISGSAKGRFRAIGAASTTTIVGSTIWVTSDRCNGTLTEIGRGRARVRDLAARRTVTVRSGEAYLARARLFGARR